MRIWVSTVIAVVVVTACHQDALAPHANTNTSVPAYITVALDCAGSAQHIACAQRAAGQGHTLQESVVAAERAAMRSVSVTPNIAPGALTASAQDASSGSVIIGGQGTYVQVTFSNAPYTPGTQISAPSVTVQNLLTQPMGTTDGVTAATNGIQVFFDELPTVTGGTGPVTVLNATGTATFTQSGQPYFQYPGLLPSNATSAPMTWEFSVPSMSTTFEFKVYVATVLPNESESVITNMPSQTFATLATGEAAACAIRPGNLAYCWGFNTYGAVGVGESSSPILIPEGVLGGVTTIQSVAGGAEFACGLSSSLAYCWGDNARGQVGDGTTIDRQMPTPVANSITFNELVAGTEFACGLTPSSTINCWGANSFGQLGDGTTNDRAAPTTPTAVNNGATYSSVATGASHACALDETGTAWCWGGNVEGALGATPDSVSHPTPVAVGARVFTSLAAGNNFTCGVGVDLHVYCWGANTYGALGDGTTTDHSAPAQITGVSNVAFVAVAAGAFHACALTSTGVIYCWGDNSSGQVGAGLATTQDQYSPTAVSGSYTFTDLAAGYRYSCGLTTGGGAYCWGDGSLGELGNGGTSSSNIPVAANVP